MQTGVTLRAKVEIGNAGVSDLIRVCLIDNTGAGYALSINNTSVGIVKFDAAGTVSGLIGVTTAAPVSGDLYVIDWVPGTNRLTGYLNGVAISGLTIVDTSYTTGLAPGLGFKADNTSASTIKSWAGDGPVVASGPTITDVDGDNTITATQTDVVTTGTGFDNATVTLRDGSVVESQSIDSQTATSIQFNVSQGNIRYGVPTLRVTNADTQFSDQAITLTAPAGKSYVDLMSVNSTAAHRITAVADLAPGDQLEISNVVGGTIADVTVNDDATFDAAIAVTAFDVRAHDGTEWGAIGTQAVTGEGSDTTPDQFTFTDQSGVALASTVTSAPVTITGITDPSPISVTGGEYDINGSGVFTSAAGDVNNNDTVRARHTSSASYSTGTNTVVTVGSVSDTFTSITITDPAATAKAAGYAESVTASDSTVFEATRGLYVAGAGDLTVRMALGQNNVTFTGVTAGSVLPVCVDQVRATGTTATGIVRLW